MKYILHPEETVASQNPAFVDVAGFLLRLHTELFSFLPSKAGDFLDLATIFFTPHKTQAVKCDRHNQTWIKHSNPTVTMLVKLC
jgi:hypothetical protein